MSNAGRKSEIAGGEAECYFNFSPPACIASAINPKYHSKSCYHRPIV